MNVLVLCEFSGIVRTAFTNQGHDAISIDLLDSELLGTHITGDLLLIDRPWFSNFDLIIAHPPCQYLTRANAYRWNKIEKERNEALQFIQYILDLPCPRIALENPAGAITKAIRPPDQYIDPYQFGHPYKKHTGLWLKNLPKLIPTNVVEKGINFVDDSRDSGYASHKDRWKYRSRTFQGIADAMAQQWGNLCLTL